MSDRILRVWPDDVLSVFKAPSYVEARESDRWSAVCKCHSVVVTHSVRTNGLETGTDDA